MQAPSRTAAPQAPVNVTLFQACVTFSDESVQAVSYVDAEHRCAHTALTVCNETGEAARDQYNKQETRCSCSKFEARQRPAERGAQSSTAIRQIEISEPSGPSPQFRAGACRRAKKENRHVGERESQNECGGGFLRDRYGCGRAACYPVLPVHAPNCI